MTESSSGDSRHDQGPAEDLGLCHRWRSRRYLYIINNSKHVQCALL